MLETFTAIATAFGLPVALLAVLAYFCWKMYNNQQEQTKEQITRLTEQSHERETMFFNQLSAFQATLDKFQQTLEKIDMRLEFLEKNAQK